MSKFKVGDKVKIVNPDIGYEVYQDEIVTIEQIDNDVGYFVEENNHWWSEYELELVEPKPDLQEQIDIQENRIRRIESEVFGTGNEKEEIEWESKTPLDPMSNGPIIRYIKHKCSKPKKEKQLLKAPEFVRLLFNGISIVDKDNRHILYGSPEECYWALGSREGCGGFMKSEQAYFKRTTFGELPIGSIFISASSDIGSLNNYHLKLDNFSYYFDLLTGYERYIFCDSAEVFQVVPKEEADVYESD